jgi:hypothetical protein
MKIQPFLLICCIFKEWERYSEDKVQVWRWDASDFCLDLSSTEIWFLSFLFVFLCFFV